MSTSNLTFIIPCYNESSRLLQTEECFNHFIRATNFQGTIIFINDGSNDNTLELLNNIKQKLNKKFNDVGVDIISYKKNIGKGWAIKQGVDNCKTKWCLTLDADMAAKPDELTTWMNKKFIDLENVNTVYFGSREKGFEEGMVSSSWIRRNIGLVFNLMIIFFTGIKIRDTQCGYKLYPTAIAQKAFENLYDYGFAHDVEIIIKLSKQNISIKMLPIIWNEKSGSKVNVFKDSVKMFLTVIKLTSNYGKIKGHE